MVKLNDRASSGQSAAFKPEGKVTNQKALELISWTRKHHTLPNVCWLQYSDSNCKQHCTDHLDLLQRIVNEEDEFVSFFEEKYRYAIPKVLKLVPRNTADATKVKPTTSKGVLSNASHSKIMLLNQSPSKHLRDIWKHSSRNWTRSKWNIYRAARPTEGLGCSCWEGNISEAS